MILYFAYGMNTNLNEMSYRCPAARCLGPAVLPGYRFRFAGCADVVPDPSSSVDGVLWELTQDCMAALDILEGYPHFYNSEEVLVEHDDRIVYAEVYYMNPGHPDSAPSDGYLSMVAQGYEQCGVSTTQLELSLAELDRAGELVYN